MVNASGRLRSTLAGIGALLAISGGCAGNATHVNTTPVNAAPVNTTPVNAAPAMGTSVTDQSTMPPGFGESSTRFPCRPVSTLWISCPTLSRRDFSDSAMRERLADFLKKFDDDGRWSAPTLPIEREAEPGQATARHILRVVSTSKDVQFRGSTSGSLMMARMDVYKLSGTDQRYGIAPDPNGADWQRFFLIAKLGEPKQNAVHDGYQFGTWSIYRIVKGKQGDKDVIEQVGKSGSFRWCVMPHEQVAYENGAQYVSCEVARALQLIEQDKDISRVLQRQQASLLTVIQQEVGVTAAMTADTPVVEAALRKLLRLQDASPEALHRVVSLEQIGIIAKALQEARTAPAWMLCGAGSCIADEPEKHFPGANLPKPANW